MPSSHDFSALMTELDMVLTGKSVSEAEHTARTQSYKLADPIVFLTHGTPEYYLSDGGYSRLWANEEGEMWPSSNSLDRVKTAWNTPEAQEIVARIKAAIVSAVEAEMGGHSLSS